MALAIDAQSNSGNKTGTYNSLTWAHTCAANAVLYVGVSDCNAGTSTRITGVTYNGVAMTFVGRQYTTDAGSAEVYYTDTPTSGTHDIVVSASTTIRIIGGATSFTGAAAASLGATASAVVRPAGSSISQSITTTTTNSIIFDCLFQNGNASQTNSATGTGHTRNWFVLMTDDGEGNAGGTTTTTSVTSYTIGYNSTPDEIMGLFLAEVKANNTTTHDVRFKQGSLRPRIFGPGIAR